MVYQLTKLCGMNLCFLPCGLWMHGVEKYAICVPIGLFISCGMLKGQLLLCRMRYFDIKWDCEESLV